MSSHFEIFIATHNPLTDWSWAGSSSMVPTQFSSLELEQLGNRIPTLWETTLKRKLTNEPQQHCARQSQPGEYVEHPTQEQDRDQSVAVVHKIVSQAEALTATAHEFRTCFVHGQLDKVDQLMKEHGTSAAVMNIAERKFNDLGLQSEWLLERSSNTRVGYLTVSSANHSITFSSKVSSKPRTQTLKKILAGVTFKIPTNSKVVLSEILSSVIR